MILKDIVQNINELDDNMTIYAVEPWSCSSTAVLAIESADGSLPVELESAEFAYFLEFSLRRSFWKT